MRLKRLYPMTPLSALCCSWPVISLISCTVSHRWDFRRRVRWQFSVYVWRVWLCRVFIHDWSGWNFCALAWIIVGLLKETTSWTTAGQTKDKSSNPNPLLKALWRSRHRDWGPNHRRAVKEWSIVINHDWVHNWACSLPHNVWVISYSFIPVNKLLKLFRKVKFPNNFSNSVN